MTESIRNLEIEISGMKEAARRLGVDVKTLTEASNISLEIVRSNLNDLRLVSSHLKETLGDEISSLRNSVAQESERAERLEQMLAEVLRRLPE